MRSSIFWNFFEYSNSGNRRDDDRRDDRRDDRHDDRRDDRREDRRDDNRSTLRGGDPTDQLSADLREVVVSKIKKANAVPQNVVCNYQLCHYTLDCNYR